MINLKKVYDTLKIYLNENNIILDDTFLYVDNNIIGDIRLSTYESYIVMEMIDLKDKYQRLGYGSIIYKSLLKSALDNGYDGIFSPAFDISSGQQRSTKATNLLQKLANELGGFIENEEVDEYEMEEMEEEGMPVFGPPYLNIYIDGKK